MAHEVIGKRLSRYTPFQTPVTHKAAVFLIVFALGGPSAGILQCELTCATAAFAASSPTHCHGAAGGGPQVANGGHVCDHYAATLVAASPESVQKSPAPTALLVGSALSAQSSLMLREAVSGLSPPATILVAPALHLPLRI